jgi:hypothetical protein
MVILPVVSCISAAELIKYTLWSAFFSLRIREDHFEKRSYNPLRLDCALKTATHGGGRDILHLPINLQ